MVHPNEHSKVDLGCKGTNVWSSSELEIGLQCWMYMAGAGEWKIGRLPQGHVNISIKRGERTTDLIFKLLEIFSATKIG